MTTLPELLDDLEEEFADARRLVARSDRTIQPGTWPPRRRDGRSAIRSATWRSSTMPVGRPWSTPRCSPTRRRAMAQPGDPMQEHLDRGRAMDGGELLDWWDRAHAGMMQAFSVADPSARVPWYGPPMGVMSFVSARLMETWAHGQDIADALGEGGCRPIVSGMWPIWGSVPGRSLTWSAAWKSRPAAST